ncbi:STAS domain-containing protein [Streptomyces silvisoli]|nr:STAS domain-containing protein [Streptomyces silvisoli]
MIDVSVHETGPDTCVVTVAGELDIVSASAVQSALNAAVATHHDTVLDLARLSFCDCGGLNALITAARAAEDQGADLRLRGVPHCLVRLLWLFGSCDDFAIESFHSQGIPSPRTS